MVRAVFSTSATLISANSTTSGDPIVPPVSCENWPFKVGVFKTEGYKGLDCGSRYVGWKEMGFVLEVEYGREVFIYVTRGVEGFDVQGSVVRGSWDVQ